ncbi:import inner membrane translocase subunit tim-21, mitochondrial [Annulohypoxylon maeteangense]|uniref:import inner membrane translocase subunit tim-21, mitochondrial n=1 Tax=Annulohypoxylon maeteangense TaxID=1927788 RepID=UPI00200819C0|nr:import inner membrane translocase subunit tim-21, mitochondrial [Annulohypoxylon maeteangense]KAI0890201.1 import inner membrane translocase subunit tim-21, mitochondrial [Annulohypoxylon maeteangense]
MKLPIKPFGTSAILPRFPTALLYRGYATQQGLGNNSAASKRRAVTPFNDDGNVPWHQLSVGEKASRATQQTFNFGVVVVGLVLAGGVGYVLFEDVFSPESKTAYFSRAFDRVREDRECVALLGDSKKIVAHGEETMNKWRRARPIMSTLSTDARGIKHLMFNFYVEGPLNNGTVNAHLTKRPGHDEFEYKYLCLDVRGHQRIYLENAETRSSSGGDTKYKVFGIIWK